jgi:hypothetical protein
MVESALCLVVTLFTLSVIFDYGMLVFANNQMPYLAALGARWASVRGSASGATTNAAGVTAYVKSQAVGLTEANLAVTVTYPNGNIAGNDVVVQVSYPYVPLTKFPTATGMTLNSTVRMEIAQ